MFTAAMIQMIIMMASTIVLVEFYNKGYISSSL